MWSRVRWFLCRKLKAIRGVCGLTRKYRWLRILHGTRRNNSKKTKVSSFIICFKKRGMSHLEAWKAEKRCSISMSRPSPPFRKVRSSKTLKASSTEGWGKRGIARWGRSSRASRSLNTESAFTLHHTTICSWIAALRATCAKDCPKGVMIGFLRPEARPKSTCSNNKSSVKHQKLIS